MTASDRRDLDMFGTERIRLFDERGTRIMHGTLPPEHFPKGPGSGCSTPARILLSSIMIEEVNRLHQSEIGHV